MPREENLVWGIHGVEEAVRASARRLEYVAVLRGRADQRVQRILDLCREKRVPVRLIDREQFERLVGKATAHQGVAALAAQAAYLSLDELLARKKAERHFILALDGVEDPHNLGALLRTADASGVDGVILPERRAVGVNATVVKSSAGASEHVSIAKVVNLNRALEEMKEQNIWVVGLDEGGDRLYDQVDLTGDIAIVLGAEGAGLHDQVQKKCDFVVRIPMQGRVASLNVSAAGAVIMFEVARQRRAGAARAATSRAGETVRGLGS